MIQFELVFIDTYKVPYEYSKDSDQPAHLISLHGVRSVIAAFLLVAKNPELFFDVDSTYCKNPKVWTP